MKPSLIALALVLAACKPGSSPPPVENTGGGAEEAGGCRSDDDCMVSCARPGECCDQLCAPCEQAFLKTELAAHTQWQARSCDPAECPVARCAAPTEETFARCAAGACVVDRRP